MEFSKHCARRIGNGKAVVNNLVDKTVNFSQKWKIIILSIYLTLLLLTFNTVIIVIIYILINKLLFPFI